MDSDNLNEQALETGQPEAEAVAEAPVSESAPEEQAEASTETTSQPTRLYANKFKADTELEHGYLDLERKFHQQAGELSAYKRAATQPTTKTADEPEWKKLESERNKWAQYAAQPGLTEDQRANAWNQVSLHDRDIAEKRAIERFQEMSTRQSATEKLEARALGVIQQYEQDLSQNSQFYQAASDRYREMVRGGYPDNTYTKSLAVREAADELGIQRSKAVSQDRKGFLDNLNKQAKAAVKAGAGLATTVKAKAGPTAAEIRAMADDPSAFAKYERETALGA